MSCPGYTTTSASFLNLSASTPQLIRTVLHACFWGYMDTSQVTTLVQKLIADHTRLRQRATSSGDQSATLNAKVEELTNKVTKLLTEKMELMEQVKTVNLKWRLNARNAHTQNTSTCHWSSFVLHDTCCCRLSSLSPIHTSLSMFLLILLLLLGSRISLGGSQSIRQGAICPRVISRGCQARTGTREGSARSGAGGSAGASGGSGGESNSSGGGG